MYEVLICEKCGDNTEVVIYKGAKARACTNYKCGEIYQ